MKKVVLPIALIFFFERLFPYLSSSVPLGYDAGLYLYIFKKYHEVPFLSFLALPDWLNRASPGIAVFSKLISYFIHPENFLIPLMMFFSLLLFFSVFLLAKKLWDEKIALWTAFIFTSSAIQFRAYWYYYLDHIAAVAFLLFSFFFVVSASYWAIPFAVLVTYFHRPTAALLILSLLAQLLFNKDKRKYYATVLIATMTAAVVYYVPTYGKSVLPVMRAAGLSLIPQSFGGTLGKPSGTFYEPWQALLLSLPYLPLALFGIKKNFSKSKAFLLAPLVFSFIIILFRLYFYRRMIIFLDVFLVCFAGFGLVALSKKIKKASLRKKLFMGYALLLLIFISSFIYKTGKPLIYEDEMREISLLRETEPDAYVLVTDEYYMPYAYGWSDRRTIAPGYGEYDVYWTIPQWHQFWESGDRQVEQELLLKIPKPLYIYDGDRQPRKYYDFSGDCFRRVNWRTYQFICE